MNWTKPYYGVQHLHGLPAGWQITVVAYPTSACVCLFHLRGITPFTPEREHHGPLAECLRLGEQWGQLLRPETRPEVGNG